LFPLYFSFLLILLRISSLNKKGNGEIELDEFMQMLRKTKCVSDPEDDLRRAFKVFDLDGDGVITVN
jgi:Ca2+-binding EF-hand superfamily protein